MMQHPNDGKGARKVWVDGKPVNRVVAADAERGIAYVHDGQTRASKYPPGDRLPVVKLLTGHVVIEPL